MYQICDLSIDHSNYTFTTKLQLNSRFFFVSYRDCDPPASVYSSITPDHICVTVAIVLIFQKKNSES